MSSTPQTSTCPTALFGFLDLLKDVDWPARPAGQDSSVDVDFASQVRDVGSESVLIGQLRNDEEFSALGARSRDEDYEIAFYVQIRWPGDTAREAAERAWQLFGVIERLIASDDYIALGSEFGVLWQEIRSADGTPTREDDGGAGYVIESALRVQSRIRPRGES